MDQELADAAAYRKTSNKCPRRLLEHGPRNPGV